jgi:predicted DNA-binding WGR domain protein
MAKQARYINTTDGHAKFWQLESIGPDSVKASWGKIGKPAQGEKVYTLAEINKLIPEKFKKGYVLEVSK